MNSILFLLNSERYSEFRKPLWDNFITVSNAKCLLDDTEQMDVNSIGCIFTHSREYQEKISSIIGGIGDLPIVVFTGGMSGRAINVDKNRKSTFWMSIELLIPDPEIDKLIVELLLKIKNCATTKEILEYICTLNRNTYPETLIASYLVMIGIEKIGKVDGLLKSLNPDQWKVAYEEYKETCNRYDIKVHDWSNFSEWSIDSEKIKAVRENIGKLLADVTSNS